MLHKEQIPMILLYAVLILIRLVLKYSLRITPKLAWSLTFQGTLLKKDQSPLLIDHLAKLSSVDDIEAIIIAVNDYQICEGNSDESFITLSQARANKGCFLMPQVDKNCCTCTIITLNSCIGGTEVAREECQYLGYPTIRHIKCSIFLNPST